MKEGWTDKLKEQLNEGCKVKGFIEVSKVAGNFHIAPGKSFQQHSVHGKAIARVSVCVCASMMVAFFQLQCMISKHLA